MNTLIAGILALTTLCNTTTICENGIVTHTTNSGSLIEFFDDTGYYVEGEDLPEGDKVSVLFIGEMVFVTNITKEEEFIAI